MLRRERERDREWERASEGKSFSVYLAKLILLFFLPKSYSDCNRDREEEPKKAVAPVVWEGGLCPQQLFNISCKSLNKFNMPHSFLANILLIHDQFYLCPQQINFLSPSLEEGPMWLYSSKFIYWKGWDLILSPVSIVASPRRRSAVNTRLTKHTTCVVYFIEFTIVCD